MAKYLECPDCGFIFKAPVADIKFTHIGFTFPGLGLVRCPECKGEKRRKYYRKVQESDPSNNSAHIADKEVMPNLTSGDDMESGSKFEHE